MKKAILDRLKLLAGRYSRTSFSQEGEDLLLDRLFEQKRNGFYIDIGAHHPYRFSNTYLFYQKGWHGLNVDPQPGTRAIFQLLRPRDTTLELGVSSSPSTLTYYRFAEPALNTFSKDVVEQRLRQGFEIHGEEKISTLPLRDIFEAYIPNGQDIDFLSVDVEGFDEVVLRSNDWGRFKPKFVIAEILDHDLMAAPISSLANYMRSQGYRIESKLGHSVIFARSQ